MFQVPDTAVALVSAKGRFPVVAGIRIVSQHPMMSLDQKESFVKLMRAVVVYESRTQERGNAR